MLPVLVSALVAALDASPAPRCAAADIAVTEIRIKLIKKRKAPDRYIVTGTLANTGEKPQDSGVTQHVELIERGTPAAPQPLPALLPGVRYDVAFTVYRPSELRREPLSVTVRYVLDRGDAARNNCSTANDALTKTF